MLEHIYYENFDEALELKKSDEVLGYKQKFGYYIKKKSKVFTHNYVFEDEE